MARAPAGVPASTRFLTNRITGLAAFAIGAGSIVSYLLGNRASTDNTSTGVSNTTLIVVAVVSLGIAYISANARG